jgi:hypothetical protein
MGERKKERKEERKIYSRLLRPELAHETKDTTVGCVPNHPKYKTLKPNKRCFSPWPTCLCLCLC